MMSELSKIMHFSDLDLLANVPKLFFTLTLSCSLILIFFILAYTDILKYRSIDTHAGLQDRLRTCYGTALQFCSALTPLSLALDWREWQRKNRELQEDKRKEEGLSLDWLKTSSQSARSWARAVCSSLKFSLTRTVSSSIQDLFIGSLMLTQCVFNVRNKVAKG